MSREVAEVRPAQQAGPVAITPRYRNCDTDRPPRLADPHAATPPGAGGRWALNIDAADRRQPFHSPGLRGNPADAPPGKVRLWESQRDFQPKAEGVGRQWKALQGPVTCGPEGRAVARSAQRNPAGHPRAFHARATGPGWVDPLPAKAGRRGGEMLSESESMMSIPERSGERTGDGLRLGDHPGLPWVASESRMGSEFGAGSGPNSRTIRRTDGKPHFVILG